MVNVKIADFILERVFPFVKQRNIYKFVTDKQQYIVDFESISKFKNISVFERSFTTTQFGYGMTNENIPFSVIGTVREITYDFLIKHKPDVILAYHKHEVGRNDSVVSRRANIMKRFYEDLPSGYDYEFVGSSSIVYQKGTDISGVVEYFKEYYSDKDIDHSDDENMDYDLY